MRLALIRIISMVAPMMAGGPSSLTDHGSKPPNLALPPKALIESWVKFGKPPSDYASAALDGLEHDLSKLWSWNLIDQKAKPATGRYLNPEWGYGSTAWVAVFKTVGPWLLVFEEQEGWTWILLRESDCERLGWTGSNGDRSPLFSILQGPHGLWKPKHPLPEKDGWVTYRTIDCICPVEGEVLRVTPSLNAKSIGPTKGSYFRLIKFQGDWVQVQEASAVRENQLGLPDDHMPMLQIRWDEKRTGWIRWRVPTKIPGVWSNRLRGKAEFGIID